MKQITAGGSSTAYDDVVDVAASYGVRLVHRAGGGPGPASRVELGLRQGRLATVQQSAGRHGSLQGRGKRTRRLGAGNGRADLSRGGGACGSHRRANSCRSDLRLPVDLRAAGFSRGSRSGRFVLRYPVPVGNALSLTPVRGGAPRPGSARACAPLSMPPVARIRRRSSGWSSCPPVSSRGNSQRWCRQRVPGSPMISASWEIGITVIYKGKVRQESSGRISINQPGVRSSSRRRPVSHPDRTRSPRWRRKPTRARSSRASSKGSGRPQCGRSGGRPDRIAAACLRRFPARRDLAQGRLARSWTG